MPRSKISPASALGGVGSSRGSRDLSSRSAAVLSADEARRLALRSQGLLGAPNRRAGVTGVLRQLGAVQLDTISVLARSHELVAYSRAVADLADYYRLRQDQVVTVLDSSGLVPVEVRGWGSSPNGSSRGGTVRRTATAPAWAHPESLAAPARGHHRTTLLSPFDSLIWERRRTARIFGWAQGIEAYKPATQREHGYFVMPLLAGGKLLGRVDPKREGRTLVAKQLSVETPQAVEAMARALREAAEWVGCDGVAVERVTPPDLAVRLHSALAAVT